MNPGLAERGWSGASVLLHRVGFRSPHWRSESRVVVTKATRTMQTAPMSRRAPGPLERTAQKHPSARVGSSSSAWIPSGPTASADTLRPQPRPISNRSPPRGCDSTTSTPPPPLRFRRQCRSLRASMRSSTASGTRPPFSRPKSRRLRNCCARRAIGPG